MLQAQGSCWSFPPRAAGASPGWPGAPEQRGSRLPRLCKRRGPAGPHPRCARRPDPPLHLSPSCACRQEPGGCHPPPRAASAHAPCPRLPPATSALLLQLLARQGVRLLLPPGHHLGEHSRVSYGGIQVGLQGRGWGPLACWGISGTCQPPWGHWAVISSHQLLLWLPMWGLPGQYSGLAPENPPRSLVSEWGLHFPDRGTQAQRG